MAADINVKLNKIAHVNKSNVTLGDIAEIDADNPVIRLRLGDVFIMKSPRIGYVGSISLSSVHRLVSKNHEFRRLDIQYIGQEKIHIHSRGRRHSYSVIEEIASKELRNLLEAKDRDVELSAAVKTTEINLPYGALEFEARTNTNNISSKMCVWVDVSLKGGFYQSIPVWFNVKVVEPVYVAKNNIEQRQVVSKEDFDVQKKDVAKVTGRNIKLDGFKGRLLLKKAMLQGEVIRYDNVKPVPAVVAGKQLKAFVNERGVSIQIDAIAKNDADIGEIIKVKSLQSGGVLKVKVIGEQLVEVI